MVEFWTLFRVGELEGNGLLGAAMGLGMSREVFEGKDWEGWEIIGLGTLHGRGGREVNCESHGDIGSGSNGQWKSLNAITKESLDSRSASVDILDTVLGGLQRRDLLSLGQQED